MKRVNRFLLRERYEPKDFFDEVKFHINLPGRQSNLKRLQDKAFGQYR